MSWAEPVRLAHDRVLLEPLGGSHAADLAAALADGELSTMWYTSVPTPDGSPPCAWSKSSARPRTAG